MTTRKRAKHVMPLIVESHPNDYTGYPFITLIKFRQEHILTIIDNSDDKSIIAYVLDDCGPAKVSEELLVTIANEWYDHNSDNYPLSIEFSKRGVHDQFGLILRTFNIEFISRIIGPVPYYEMDEALAVKRKRRKPISAAVEIRRNNVITL